MSTVKINLVKGQRIDLSKAVPDLKNIVAAAGWDVKNGDSTYDLDIFAFLLTDKGTKLLPGDMGVIYFNNKVANGLTHGGDNKTGQGDGDDESIKINLSEVPNEVDTILIGINIFDAVAKGNQNFGQVENAFIRVYNEDDSTHEFGKFDLTEDYSAFNAIMAAKVYQKDGFWKFEAVGEGKNGNLTEFAAAY